MGLGEAGVIRADDFLKHAVADLSERLREAAWGRADWGEVCHCLEGILPGSAPSIVNYDLPRGVINATFARGIAPDYLESYHAYYGGQNPWLDFWAVAPAGKVMISERDSPSSAFRKSEFYTDWLAPQGNMTAAVGLRLDVDAHNLIHIAWHYSVADAEVYDRPASAVLEEVKRSFADAVRAAALLRDGVEHRLRFGALLERIDGAALLVERDRRIREANSEAAAAMQAGKLVNGAGGMLCLRDGAGQRWLEENLARLVDGQPVAATTTVIRNEQRIFRVGLTVAPDYVEEGFAALVRPRPVVLVVIRQLAGGKSRIDETSLRFAFGLSTAEVRLCEVLANGHSLAQAAEMLGISEGTVRQRVKVVFQKTGTHRQGELIALLGRFRLSD
jgi:DNA-binding CsgD family transcriptional regulator